MPLSQLAVIHAEDEETKQAVEDWLYWVGRGISFDGLSTDDECEPYPLLSRQMSRIILEYAH